MENEAISEIVSVTGQRIRFWCLHIVARVTTTHKTMANMAIKNCFSLYGKISFGNGSLLVCFGLFKSVCYAVKSVSIRGPSIYRKC